MLTMRTASSVLAVVLVLGAAGAASAQQTDESTSLKLGGFNLEGYGEAGVRFFIERPSEKERAKFEEYRDINEGLYLQDLDLRLFTPDEKYSFTLGGRDWGLHTQEFHLGGERLGLWEAGFDWDQMRHIISTDARMLATETSDGVFTLPRPRPPLSAYNSGRELDDIAVQWNTAHMFFKLTPTPDLDLVAEYTRIRKDGDKPFGMAFGSPGNLFMEILQPIDQTIHDFRVRGTWATERWQLQFSYVASFFENDLSFVRADNPCSPAPVPSAPCSASDITGGQFGTSSLPPTNQAHTFSLSGGVNLPARTRINANFTYGFRYQNADFLPMTSSNTLPLNNPALGLPKKSLEANVQTALFNITATSRPLPIPVTFTAKYRFYDLMDPTDQLVFSAFVVDDVNSITQGPQRANRFTYQRQNADLDGRWQIVQPLALTLGTAWERWNRNDSREVPTTDEFFAKAALDWAPTEWLMVRATYLPSFKRMDQYNTNALAQAEEAAEPGELGQSYLLRKFDEADRDRHRADLLVNIMPFENLTITPAIGYRDDDYIASGLTHDSVARSPVEGNTLLGLQHMTTWSAGVDLNWKLVERVVLDAGYMREYNFQKMRSRVRPPDAPDLDWISDITDTVDTIHAGITGRLIPGILDLRLGFNYEYALGRVETRNPNAVGSALLNATQNAQARPFPAYEDSLLQLNASLRYHFAKAWVASLNYTFERFRKQNWQTDQLDPFIPGVSSIWLGNDLKDYDAHIIGITMAYLFR